MNPTAREGLDDLRVIGDIGGTVVSVSYAVANFFIGIFRGAALVPNGGIMEGLYTIGDGAGITRGLMQASVTGMAVADDIVSRA